MKKITNLPYIHIEKPMCYTIDDIKADSILICQPVRRDPYKKLNISSNKGKSLISIILTEKLINQLKIQLYIDYELNRGNSNVLNEDFKNLKIMKVIK